MKEIRLIGSDSHVYPGEFVPILEEQSSISKVGDTTKNTIIKPLVNMTEMQDLLKIEVFIPGVKKEDILVEINENILSVIVTNKKEITCVGEVCTLHEFDSNKFERKIPLPKNSDITFINAEYNGGVLKLHIPKTSNENLYKQMRVVVY